MGEIEDEFDPDNKYLTKLSDREWLVDGRFSIDDAIELGWPIEDSEEYETIAGFVLELADKVPHPGTSSRRKASSSAFSPCGAAASRCCASSLPSPPPRLRTTTLAREE